MEGPIIPVGNPDPKLRNRNDVSLTTERVRDEGFTSMQELTSAEWRTEAKLPSPSAALAFQHSWQPDSCSVGYR